MTLLLRHIILALLIALSSCSGLKQLHSEAEILENEGMHREAYNRYLEAYSQKGKAEALVGMKRNASLILQSLASNVRMAYLAGNYEDVEALSDEYFSARQSLEAAQLGIPEDLEIKTFVADSKNKQADALVASAQKKLLDGDYESARTDIRNLQILNRNDSRADDLWTLSELVEAYRMGKQAEELGLLDQAFYAYDKVVKIDAGFRDALALRNDLKERLSYTLAYISIPSSFDNNEIERSLSGRITSRILGANSPFIRLLERDNLQTIIDEQLIGMSALFDEESATEVGKLAGAEYVLTGELISLDVKLFSPEITEQKGYLGRTTKDKRVTYLEIKQAFEQQAEFRWQLIDAVTGMVHRTGIIPFSDRGQLHYAEFEGDGSQLYPGQWTLPVGNVPVHWVGYPSDKVFTDQASKESLDKLLSEKTRHPDKESMRTSILDAIADQIASEVLSFRPPYY